MASLVPKRTCVGCRARRDKAALVRLVRRPDGMVVFDQDGSAEGRGAYLCADGACWRIALKRGALERALRISLPLELRTRLEQGDVAAVRVATGAPATITGGTDGT